MVARFEAAGRDGDRGTLGGETLGDRSADTSAGAGHQHPPSLEASGHVMGPRVIVVCGFDTGRAVWSAQWIDGHSITFRMDQTAPSL
jgi:hypothetical protein